MSLVALASAKASPGTTTAALALAALWPAERGVVVVEADPAGGDLVPRFGLAPTPGLVSMGAQRRRRLTGAEVWSATQAGGTPVLVGPTTPEEAGALRHLWPELAGVLAALPGHRRPGRLRAPVARLPRPRRAPSRRGGGDRGPAHPGGGGPPQDSPGRALDPGRVEVVLVGTGPYPPEQVEQALGRKVLGVLAQDERAAAALAGRAGSARLLARSALLRSARPLVAVLAARLPALAVHEDSVPTHVPTGGEGFHAAANDDVGLGVRR